MNFEEFQYKIQKRNTFDKYWYYAICFAIIGLGLFWIYLIITQPSKFNILTVYAAAVFCLTSGSYGLYILPNRYKVIVVKDSSPIHKKFNVVCQMLTDYEIQCPQQIEPYLFFTIKKRFWHSPFQVHLFIDQDCFAFSVQGHEVDGGFIDFGGTEKKRKQIETKLKELSLSQPAANMVFQQ
jgi:hypothetical protein